MSRIRILQSSSTHLALFFSAMLTIALGFLGVESGLIETHAAEHLQAVRWVILALVFLCVGLFIISFYVTKRINSIVAIADSIMHTGDLSQRIPIDSKWDDLSKLSLTLNSMLDTIEESVHGIRTVADNIAHDLRHPLTRLRNRLESAASQPLPSSDAYAQEMAHLVHECDGLLATFNALLRIANIESGRRHAGFSDVALERIVHDVTEMYEPLAHEKDVTFTVETIPVTLRGDRDLLFQLLTNLCDNAVKYCPHGASVSVRLSQSKSHALLAICDTGLGISDDDKEKIFRRFYRADKSRTSEGIGLGLSLVKAIVSLHRGSIVVRDHQPQGTCFEVRLPF